VTNADDLPQIQTLDELTSMRTRAERGDLDFVTPGERAQGPGSQYINASFAYSLFGESRFGNGTYGVFYGAKTLGTAIGETVYHREQFMRWTSEEPMMLSMRVLDASLEGHFHDIRGRKRQLADVYSPKNYSHSQTLAHQLWSEGSDGIVYDSVRSEGGECVSVFKPKLLTKCRQERQLVYEWDGHKITTIYELQEFLKLS
jgi:hypothetical protein